MASSSGTPSSEAAGSGLLPGIVLSGLRPFTKAKQVHAAAAGLELDGYVGSTKKPGKHMAFLAFETEEARDAALSALPDSAKDLQKIFKSTSRVSAKVAGSGVSRRGMVGPGGKRPRGDGGESAAKRARGPSAGPSAPRTVHSATTPLLGLPYSAQLMRKQEQTLRMTVRLVRSIRNASLKAIKKAMAKGTAQEAAEAASKTSSAGYRRMPPEYLPVELWERATRVAPGLGVARAPAQPAVEAGDAAKVPPSEATEGSAGSPDEAPAAAAADPGAADASSSVPAEAATAKAEEAGAAPAAPGAADPAAADATGDDDAPDGAAALDPAAAAAVARVISAPAAELGRAGYLGSAPGRFVPLACSGRLLCAPIVPSPALLGFRNKVNFTIGRSPGRADAKAETAGAEAAGSGDATGSGLTVGFRVSSFSEGSDVAPCAASAVTPAVAKAAALATEVALQGSGVGPQVKGGGGADGGAWRMLTVRVSESSDDVMLVLEVAADDVIVDAVAAAVEAEAAGAAEDAVPAPGSALPSSLSALPEAVRAGLVSWRDAVLGAGGLRLSDPASLPATASEGLPPVPQGLVGGGNDLRVTTACGSLLLQSAGHSPAGPGGDARHRVPVLAAAASAVAAAPADEAAAKACADAAMGPAPPAAAAAEGGTPATSWRRAVPAETLRLRDGLAAAVRSAAEDKAGRTLAPTAADYARAGLAAPATARPSTAPASSASSAGAAAPRMGLASGAVDLFGPPPPGAAAVPGLGRPPTAVMVQVARRASHYGVDPSKPTVRLAGAPVIHDAILGRRFRISPLAFFQTNTLGACRLYGAVRDAVEGSGAASILGPPCPALTASYTVMPGLDAAWDEQDRWARHPAAGPGPGAFDRTSLEDRPAPSASSSSPDHPAAAGARPRIILDVFCGSGTIGISLARPGIDAVVGVELNAAAVRDAADNAAANGLTVIRGADPAAPALPADARGTASYIASRAESAMHDLFRLAGLVPDAAGSWVLPPAASARFGGVRPAVVVVVDPPRAGLAMGVVHALRSCPAVSRLVYVSCNPFGTFPDNAVSLCSAPVVGRGASAVKQVPFRPVMVQPVDMFPHTDHTELVAVFERAPPAYKCQEELVAFEDGAWA